jgi:ribosome-binding factor A
MLAQIQKAGLDKLWFTWAGYTEHVLGKPYYYRIQGPSIIIEYDNSQNNANHIHTVIRDLTNDFGSDLLLEHYRASH